MLRTGTLQDFSLQIFRRILDFHPLLGTQRHGQSLERLARLGCPMYIHDERTDHKEMHPPGNVTVSHKFRNVKILDKVLARF